MVAGQTTTTWSRKFKPIFVRLIWGFVTFYIGIGPYTLTLGLKDLPRTLLGLAQFLLILIFSLKMHFIAMRSKFIHDLLLYDPWNWAAVLYSIYIEYPTIFLLAKLSFRVWATNKHGSIICYIWQIKLTHDLLLYDPWKYKAQSTLDILPYFLDQVVLLEFGRPTNTAEAPVQCSRQTSKTSDIGLSKTNNKIGNLGRSQNPRQKATGPRGYNTILWSIAVTIDSKTYKRTEFYYLLFCHSIVTYQAYFWHPPSCFSLKVFQSLWNILTIKLWFKKSASSSFLIIKTNLKLTKILRTM